MPDDQVAANPQAGTAAQPQAGTQGTSVPLSTPQAGTAPEPQAGAGGEAMSLEHARELRRENQTMRQRLKQLEDAAKAAEDAKLSDTERTTKRLAELERQQSDWQRERQELTTRYAIERQAAKLGIVDPDAAYRLLDLASLEFDEDGGPKNVEKALTDLLKARPYLAGQQAATVATSSGAMTNAASGQAGASRAGTFTKSQIADRAFWSAHRAEIMAAMAEGRIVDG